MAPLTHWNAQPGEHGECGAAVDDDGDNDNQQGG